MITQDVQAQPAQQASLSVDAQLRIRDELHALQVGLNLLRDEMLAGDFRGADLTYATMQHCLGRLSADPALAKADDAALASTGAGRPSELC